MKLKVEVKERADSRPNNELWYWRIIDLDAPLINNEPDVKIKSEDIYKSEDKCIEGMLDILIMLKERNYKFSSEIEKYTDRQKK